MRIGVLCGSFDPIHNGHLELAEKASISCSLDRVYFVVYDKPYSVESRKNRLQMVQCAIANNEKLYVDNTDYGSPANAYFAYLEKYKNDSIYVIFDATSFSTFMDHPRFIEFAHMNITFLVGNHPFARRGQKCSTFNEVYKLAPCAYVVSFEMLGGKIATYKIRNVLQRNLFRDKEVRYIIPDTVIQYIEEKGLYKNEK